MTREEADKLQKALDDYVDIRDSEAKKEYTLGDKKLRGAPMLLRLQLAQFIEPLLPEVRFDGGMDLMGLAGTLASVLGVKVERSDGAMSVVDGHEEVDPEDIGWEEFERLYCVRVPGDVMKEALNVRSTKAVFEMAMKKGPPEPT